MSKNDEKVRLQLTRAELFALLDLVIKEIQKRPVEQWEQPLPRILAVLYKAAKGGENVRSQTGTGKN